MNEFKVGLLALASLISIAYSEPEQCAMALRFSKLKANFEKVKILSN